jgi:hypothetical protein
MIHDAHEPRSGEIDKLSAPRVPQQSIVSKARSASSGCWSTNTKCSLLFAFASTIPGIPKMVQIS